MKGFSITVLAAIFFTGSIAAAVEMHDIGDIEPYIFEDLINKTLEELRPLLPDPLTIENVSLNFNDNFLKGVLESSKLTLTGLPGFHVPSLHLGLLFGIRLNITLVLSINVSLDYLLDAVILDLLPIYGEGDVGVHLSNLELTISTQADLPTIQLEDFNLQLGLTNITDFFINGFLYDQNSSTLLTQLGNEFIAPLVVTFIDENQAIITKAISPIIEDIINELLNGNKTLTEDSLRESFEEFLHDDRLHDLLPEDFSHLISTFVRDIVFEMLSSHKIDVFLCDFKMLENHQGQIDAFLASLQQKLVDNGAKRLHLP